MKRFMGFMMGMVMLIATGCSHEEKVTETPVAATTTDQTYVVNAQREIADLQTRLDTLRDASHSEKYSGNRAQLRNLVNDEYSRLGEAKRELLDLQAATATDFPEKRAKLESTLINIRGTLDSATAE